MARTAAETASILREIYDEEFGGDESEPYQLGWYQLRGIAGVERMSMRWILGWATRATYRLRQVK